MVHHTRGPNHTTARQPREAAESSEDDQAPRATVVPRKARSHRPLDATGVLHPLNRPVRPGLTGRQFTFLDGDVAELLAVLPSCLPKELRDALLEMDKQLARAQTEEGRHAVAALMLGLTSRWLRQAAYRSCQAKPEPRAAKAKARPPKQQQPRTKLKLDLNPGIKGKVIEERANALLREVSAAYAAHQGGLWVKTPGQAHDEPESHPHATLLRLIKDSATNLELREAAWLEGQGVPHWEAALAQRSTSDDDVFYLTEDDVGAQQERLHGRRKYTPDFVLVDRHRRPVRVPVKLSRDSGAGKAQQPCLPFITVIEVKGFVRLPCGLTEQEPWDRVRLNLSRYTRHFGPCLLLQKHGISREAVDMLAAEVDRCAVASLEVHRLPALPHLRNPFDCGRDDREAVPPLLVASAAASPEADDLARLAAVEPLAVQLCRHLSLVGRRVGDNTSWRDLVLGLGVGLFGGWKARLVVRLQRELEQDTDSEDTGSEEEEDPGYLNQNANLDSWEVLCEPSEPSPVPAVAAPAAAVVSARPPLPPPGEPSEEGELGPPALDLDLDRLGRWDNLVHAVVSRRRQILDQRADAALRSPSPTDRQRSTSTNVVHRRLAAKAAAAEGHVL